MYEIFASHKAVVDLRRAAWMRLLRKHRTVVFWSDSVNNKFMQTAKAISHLFLWFVFGIIAAPLLFGAFDGIYVWLTNRKTLTLQLDPLVIQVLGKYESLLWPLPLYFLVGVISGLLGLAFGAYKRVDAPKQT